MPKDLQELVIKEKYGSSPKEIRYSKPEGQANVIITEDFSYIDFSNWFTRIFLPQGYPDSVSSDYLAYQKWDTAQAFCSTITGILATQEVLRGVGVGDTNATPLAATVTWVFKDGCGHVGRILFAFSYGTCLDAYSKKWRLYADTLNDAAMCIEIALPFFKSYTTFALCVSTVMKSIVGVAGGATRAAMTQHHALRGNMADVAAKDSAQETAVNLVASFTALLIIYLFGNSIYIFVLMMILHIAFNYFAVRAVCLRTLNEPRYLQVIDAYLKEEVIMSPCEINRNEPIIFYQLAHNLLDLKKCGFQIKLGHSIKKFIEKNPSASHLNDIISIYNSRNYLIFPAIHERKMYIIYKENVTTDDIMCSYFHAVILSMITCAINGSNLSVYLQNSTKPRPFADVCRTVQDAEWSRQLTLHSEYSSDFDYEPSYELMVYVDQIVIKEWYRICVGLEHTGWILNKHLLMVDEWRVRSKLFSPKKETPPNTPSATDNDFQSKPQLIINDIYENITEDLKDFEPYTIEPDTSTTDSVKKIEPNVVHGKDKTKKNK